MSLSFPFQVGWSEVHFIQCTKKVLVSEIPFTYSYGCTWNPVQSFYIASIKGCVLFPRFILSIKTAAESNWISS